MADNILEISMKIEIVGPVGWQPKKLVSNTAVWRGRGWKHHEKLRLRKKKLKKN